MSREIMDVFLNISDWYASPKETFIMMYNMEKALLMLSRFATEKLVMQEVSYHISTGFSARL